MSKAFTRESDDAEEIPVIRSQLPPGTRNYVTREGADRLRQRLNELIARKQASSDAEQRKLESAIRNLQLTLNTVVVAELPADREKVAFGAAVTVRHANGEEETYRTVGVEEADPENGAISWLSPLARALMSRRAGEKTRFKSPAGEEELTIVKVAYD